MRFAKGAPLALFVCGIALKVLLHAQAETLSTLLSMVTFQTMLIVFSLALAVVFGYIYPIHIYHRTQVNMTSVPLYLMAVLLPPWLAATTIGVSILIGEILARRERNRRWNEIVVSMARWVIVGLLGSCIAHMPGGEHPFKIITLIGTAIILYVGDWVSVSFQLSPLTGEPVWRVLAVIFREGFLLEGIQYLIGMGGAILALHAQWTMLFLAFPVYVVYLIFKNKKELHQDTLEVLENLVDAVDLRDPYTGAHSREVAELCAGILEELGIGGMEADLIVSAARMHDIGKIEIPIEILLKPEPLSPEEHAIMMSHVERGAALLSHLQDFSRGARFVRHHHERWDGHGYPDRLKEYAIPRGARIIAVADAFHAMTSDRPYRRAMSRAQALLALQMGGGKQWDPFVVQALLRSIGYRPGRVEMVEARSIQQTAVTVVD